MPPVKKPAKVSAATSEVAAEDAPRSIEWHGLTLELKDELPADLLWVLPELDDKGPAALVGLLDALIGPEQVVTVRAQLNTEGLGFQAAIDELTVLLDAAATAYGLTAEN